LLQSYRILKDYEAGERHARELDAFEHELAAMRDLMDSLS
jgi:hypothetical protein